MFLEHSKAAIMWIWENKLILAFLGIVIYNRKSLWKFFIKDPITGGNGVTQPDELAKWLLMASFVVMLATFTIVAWPLELFAMILLSMIAIAKLDKLLEIILEYYKSKKDGTKVDNNKDKGFGDYGG